MSEWPKETALKAVGCNSLAGSNPVASALAFAQAFAGTGLKVSERLLRHLLLVLTDLKLTIDADVVSAHTKSMTTIATAQATSTAPAAQFFALWADMATWPEWNSDTEWVRLDGPFVQGATGVLQPKGGPKVGFTVEKLTDNEFVDVSKLWGARLTFAHAISEAPAGNQVSVEISLTGTLSRLWAVIMGGGLRKSAQRDLDALIGTAEAKSDGRGSATVDSADAR